MVCLRAMYLTAVILLVMANGSHIHEFKGSLKGRGYINRVNLLLLRSRRSWRATLNWSLSPDPNKRKNYRDRAIANKNNGSEAEKLRVDIYVADRDGRLIDVINFSKELVNKYPNSSEAYTILGNAYTAVQDFDKAIVQYNKALTINS